MSSTRCLSYSDPWLLSVGKMPEPCDASATRPETESALWVLAEHGGEATLPRKFLNIILHQETLRTLVPSKWLQLQAKGLERTNWSYLKSVNELKLCRTQIPSQPAMPWTRFVGSKSLCLTGSRTQKASLALKRLRMWML